MNKRRPLFEDKEVITKVFEAEATDVIKIEDSGVTARFHVKYDDKIPRIENMEITPPRQITPIYLKKIVSRILGRLYQEIFTETTE